MRVTYLLAMLIAACGASGQEYFRPGSLGRTAREHQLRAEWYTPQLAALGENSLWALSREQPDQRVLRFLWLRTFHHPICVRVSVGSDGTGALRVKETNGAGGYQPGTLIRERARVISADQVRSLFERAHSLQLGQTDSVGLDGAQWIFEVVERGGYRLVDVWSPPADDPVHQLGIELVRLSGIKVPNRDVY